MRLSRQRKLIVRPFFFFVYTGVQATINSLLCTYLRQWSQRKCPFLCDWKKNENCRLVLPTSQSFVCLDLHSVECNISAKKWKKNGWYNISTKSMSWSEIINKTKWIWTFFSLFKLKIVHYTVIFNGQGTVKKNLFIIVTVMTCKQFFVVRPCIG